MFKMFHKHDWIYKNCNPEIKHDAFLGNDSWWQRKCIICKLKEIATEPGNTVWRNARQAPYLEYNSYDEAIKKHEEYIKNMNEW